MKRYLSAFLLVLLCLTPVSVRYWIQQAYGAEICRDDDFCYEDIGYLARMNPAILGASSGAACVASYGDELAVNNNASDAGGSETDATTGWTSTGLAVMDSVDTGTPYSGSYHMILTADSDGDRATWAIPSMTPGTIYRYSFFAKHDGTSSAPWRYSLWTAAGNAFGRSIAIPETATSYSNYKLYFIHNSLVNRFRIAEYNSGNNGSVYIDSFSLKTAALCYGTELYTHANAANIASEANATTGWTAFTGDSSVTSTSDDTPPSGSYQLKIATTASLGGAYADIGNDFSLENGKKYFISFSVRGDGTNFWKSIIGANPTNIASECLTEATFSSATHSLVGYDFIYSANCRYLKFFESNAGNTGYAYVDKISIREIIGE